MLLLGLYSLLYSFNEKNLGRVVGTPVKGRVDLKTQRTFTKIFTYKTLCFAQIRLFLETNLWHIISSNVYHKVRYDIKILHVEYVVARANRWSATLACLLVNLTIVSTLLNVSVNSFFSLIF